MPCPVPRCQGRAAEWIWVTAPGPAQPSGTKVSMGAHGARGESFGGASTLLSAMCRVLAWPLARRRRCRTQMLQRWEILGANPTGGEASGTLATLAACGVPRGGHRSSAPQGAPGANPGECVGLFLGWGSPGTLARCWGCSWLMRCPVALGTPRQSPCRKCPRPESPGGCAVPWPRCSWHLGLGNPGAPGRMCGARLAQGLGTRGALAAPSLLLAIPGLP